MTPEQFTYWLQGIMEFRKTIGQEDSKMRPNTVKMIEDHLQLVFNKVTPQYGLSIQTTPSFDHSKLLQQVTC